MTLRQSATGNRQCIAWQGLSLDVPGDWNPVRIEGDWRSGFVLLADLHKPRLGLRWGAAGGRRFDAAIWARGAMRDELGVLAAQQAKPLALGAFEPSIHFPEPEPPGRDVWVGYSPTSGRGVELVYHAPRRDDVLVSRILPTLRDCARDAATPWSVFDLNCVAPAGMTLRSHDFSAGDLRLAFACGKSGRFASVRQVAVAKLALSRMPLAKWLADDLRARRVHYTSSAGEFDVAQEASDGRPLRGVGRNLRRRWRSFFMRRIPRELVAAALHDESRDRLVLVQASADELLDEIVRSVGCAASR